MTYSPFPYPGKTLETDRLAQLWVDEVDAYRGDITYRLMARMRGGPDIILAVGDFNGDGLGDIAKADDTNRVSVHMSDP